MKKIYINLVIGFLIVTTLVIAGIGSIARRNTIGVSREAFEILNAKGLTDITISNLTCDGETCISSSKAKIGNEKDPEWYSMGSVSIPQKYCSLDNGCKEEGNCSMGCLEISEYTTEQLENNETESYVLVWEKKAKDIRDDEEKVIETKIDESEVTINAK